MPGSVRLSKCEQLPDILQRHVLERRIYAAISAAPVIILQEHGFLKVR